MDSHQNVLMSEFYFLIQKFLSASPLKETFKVFSEEIKKNNLLPMRLDWIGNKHELSFDELEGLYKHINPEHLFKICLKLASIFEKSSTINTKAKITLLGLSKHVQFNDGLKQEKNQLLQFFAARKHGAPYHFISNVKNYNLVQNIIGQEIGGPMYRKFIITPSFYSHLQLQRQTLGHLSAVYCLLFDHTGKYIVTGADDLLVKLWSTYSGRLLYTFRGASAEITDIDINLENTLLAAGSIDKVLRVWDLQTGVPVAVLICHTGMITSVNFCPSTRSYARYLITTSTDGSVAFWTYNQDAKNKYTFMPKPILYQEKIRPGQAQMICSSFSPGGAFLATGSADHHVRVYSMHGDEGPQRILEVEAHIDCVDSIAWAHSGLRFISGSKDGTAKIWHFECQQWKSIELSIASDMTNEPTSTAEANKKFKVTMVAWDCCDEMIVTADSECKLKVWNSKTGKLDKVLSMHTAEIYVLESHPLDRNILLSAGHDGQVIIWDLTNEQPVAKFTNNIEGQGCGGVFDAKWSPDGTMIAASDSHGHILMFGFGPGNSRFKDLPKELFFHTDYRPLVRDTNHWVLDEQTQVPPHLMPPPFLVDIDGNPYPPVLQRLVPGRENCKTDQLVPNIVVGNEGTQEVIEGLPNERRSHLDRMIEELIQRQVAIVVNDDSPSDQPMSRNSLRNNSRRSGDEGVRQSSGDWQRDPNIKWKKHVLVQALTLPQLENALKIIEYHSNLELTDYKNEMKRRLTMISTATNATTSHSREKKPRKPRNRNARTYQLRYINYANDDAELSAPSEQDDSADEDIVMNISSMSDSSNSSGYSDWNGDRGTLQPPKRSKRKQVNKQYTHNSDGDDDRADEVVKVKPRLLKCEKDVSELYKPLEWLSETMPRKAPYYPQMGDEVVYFRQGHQLYITAVTTKKLYEVMTKDIPWKRMEIKDKEFVKVVGIKYEIRPPRLCCLKLALMDADGRLTGNVFSIKYHDMADVLDFFVLKQLYDTAISRNWNLSDKFRCIIDDCWWLGEIISQSALSAEYPDSPFMCYEIRWDNGELERMSPWDLEPINEDRIPAVVGEAVPVLQEEVLSMLYQPNAEEWPHGDRQGTCAAITANLDKVMELAIAEPFLTPVDLSQYPSYAYIVEYPIDLSTIKARFENHFYRRITAAQFDVRYLATNAEKFNESRSIIVKHARIITELCLRVIRCSSNIMDVNSLYHQLMDAYESSDNEMEIDIVTPGPSVTRALRSLRTRKFQNPEDWNREAKQLLDALWHNEDSYPFKMPVDRIKHPDYYQIINTPIDLGKIKQDFNAGIYATPLDFCRDVRLMFQNSKNYNTNKRSRIYTMTVRLSAMFEEHITAIIQNYNSVVSKNAANQQTITRGRRRFSITEEEEEEESSKDSGSDDDFTHNKIRKKRKLKYSSSSNQSVDENSSSESSASSSSSNSSSSDTSDSSDNKPLQRMSYMNGHKKQQNSRLVTTDGSENDSDYQPLSNLKRKSRSTNNNKKVVYNESSDEDSDIEQQQLSNSRTRSTKRKRTITDTSESDSNVAKCSRDNRSVLVTVSSRGRVRKLTPKVRAYLEK